MKTILTVFAVLCCTAVFSQAGALDSSFGSGGKFIYNNNGYPFYLAEAGAVAIQKDGKILMAGSGTSFIDLSGRDFTVIRLNKNGLLDSSFGDNGKVFIDFSNILNISYSDEQAKSIAIQPDGKIVVAGISNDYYYIDSSNTNNFVDIAVARLNTDGNLDLSFNGTGKKLIDLSLQTSANGVFNASDDYCNSVAIKSNGKIVLGGDTYVNDAVNGNNFDALIIQLNVDGSFDQTFAKSGIQIYKRSGSDEDINAIALQKDGKIVSAGTEFTNSSGKTLAMRFKAKGGIDSTFHTNGIFTVDETSGNGSYGSAVAIQLNSKIILGSQHFDQTFNTNYQVIRLSANGNLDQTFSGTGITNTNYNGTHIAAGIAIQKDGKIVQTGTQYPLYDENYMYAGNLNFEVLRYKLDGGLDSSFGTYGKSVIDFGNFTDLLIDYNYACAIQDDDKIVATGLYANLAPCAVRLLSKGKNISVTAPSNQADTLSTGECTATFTHIDPILYPDTSFSLIKYSLYTNSSLTPFDSGYGTVSGKPFNIGNTTVVYTSTIDALQRAVFNVNVTGGTPAGALDFDGVNDRVDINYLNPINSYTYGQYSFEGWIKVRGYNPSGSVIFGDERNNNGGILVQLDAKGYISTYQPSLGTVISKYKVPLNKWTHIAFVQTSAKLDLYVNGKFVQTLLNAPYLHVATYNNFYLGAYTTDYNTFSRNFNGEMDEIRVWGNAICQGQIQNNLRCEISNYTQGLVAYFKFNQGLASCNNPNVTYADGGYTSGTLQNFALNGPSSNWVAGYISGSCAVFTPLAITSYPNSINVQTTNDSCSATVNFAIGVSSGCSDSVHITYSQNPGTSFPVGTTYEYVTVQDDFGNTQYVSFPITVTENTPPTLVLKDTSIALSQYGYVYVNPYDLIDTLYDNCSPNFAISVYSYSNNYFYCSSTGANAITVSATDQSGNTTTKTATVTITPYVGSASITATPNPQQYSDVATLQATLYGAQNFYYNGCLSLPTVTFKTGSKVIGTVTMYPDYYGNLIATTNYQLTDIFPKKITATFSGLNTNAYTLPNSPVTATLNGAPENAIVDYIESQLITTSSNKLSIPVSAQITDTTDGSNGDIRKSIVTFTIQPITPGATVVGSNTLTISTLEFLNANHTSGVARGSFNVNTGGNPNAKFNIIVTVSNYYTGSTTALVYVSKSSSSFITMDSKTGSITGIKSKLTGNDFTVTLSPNPSSTQFTLQVQSGNKTAQVNIRISDAAGKILETFSKVNIGDIIQLGAGYKPGVYMAEISQRDNRKMYKLIKL